MARREGDGIGFFFPELMGMGIQFPVWEVDGNRVPLFEIVFREEDDQ